jgi:serine/arginine repetitive matrix protein 2
MYNGVGVQTARGTGTSGHVSRNFGSLKPLRNDVRTLKEIREKESRPRETDPAILQHNALRQVEVQLLQYRDELEDEYVSMHACARSVPRGISESEIEARISNRRAELRRQLESGSSESAPSDPKTESKEAFLHTQARDVRVAEAFGMTILRRNEDDPQRLAEEEARKILSSIDAERSRSRSPSDHRKPLNRRRRNRSRSSSSDSSFRK